MSTAYWDQVRSAEMAVPTDRPLPDLTAELTTMLGSPDPHVRDELAYPTLTTWNGRVPGSSSRPRSSTATTW